MPLINERESREPFDWLRRSPFSGSPVVDPHECDCGIPVGCDTTSYGEVLYQDTGNTNSQVSSDCGGETITHPNGDLYYVNFGGGDRIPSGGVAGIVAGETYHVEMDITHTRPQGGTLQLLWLETDGTQISAVTLATVVGCNSGWQFVSADLVAPSGAQKCAFYQVGSLGSYVYANSLVQGPVTLAVADVCAAINDHETQLGDHEERIDDLEADVVALEATPFLVTTAQGHLSAEVAVGATPGGELGGTWAAPTVDGTHAGSTHHAENHASRHAENGADEVEVEDLATAETDTGLRLAPDGAGGVEFAVTTTDPVDDEWVWMPLTTVIAGVPDLVWDGDNSLIPTLVPI